MRSTLRAVFLGLLTAMHFAATAAPIDVSPFVGTWRVSRDEVVMNIRIESDGRVEFSSPVNGSSMAGKALIGGTNGLTAFSGVLTNGQAFAIGLVRGAPMLSLGEAMLPMQAATEQAPAVVTQQPSTPSASTLAGLRLSTAKGRNGYFSERSYDFCADGRVYTRWAESQMSQFGSGVSERKDEGTWRQNGAALELNLARGGAVSFAVQRPEARVVRLGATSYAVERSGRCR